MEMEITGVAIATFVIVVSFGSLLACWINERRRK
jgi:hypothetical protein